MPIPRTIIEKTINTMLLCELIFENNIKEPDNSNIPIIEILRIIPLSASFPDIGLTSNITNAFGSKSMALCTSEKPR